MAEPCSAVHEIEVGGHQVAVTVSRTGAYNTQHADYLVLCLLEQIVFKGLGSRLYGLREKYGLFYSAEAEIGKHAKSEHGGFDYIIARVSPGDKETARKHILNLLQTLATNPDITEEELKAAKTWYKTATAPIRQSSSELGAFHVRCKQRHNRDCDLVLIAQEKAVNAINLTQINALCQRVFQQPFNRCYETTAAG